MTAAYPAKSGGKSGGENPVKSGDVRAGEQS